MNFSCVINPCHTVNKPYENDVVSGLSYSPADMANLTSQNRSIKMHELDAFALYDNLPSDAPMPLDYQRGIDENMLWNAAGRSHDKLNEFHRKMQKEHKSETK